MVIKVGINGFGRIGRVVFRNCSEHPDLEIAAINDPAVDLDYICYLAKFDSTHGKLKYEVTQAGDEIKIKDKQIKVFHQKMPNSIPWDLAGVQYVVEASGMFTSLEKASGHLASFSVKRVIVTAPSVDVPMVIIGVNDSKLTSEQKVISCGSSTLYCLAPIVKVLEDKYGVEEGAVTSIHAMTPSLKPLDGLCLRGKHWRDHRSIHQNIIPATTGACKALGKIIPSVKDKINGMAFRVPIVNVSVLDLNIRLSKETSLLDIFQSVEKESKSSLHNIIKISRDEAVSSDFADDSHSCILDADSSLELRPNYFKLICWYENEYSYACRVVDSIMLSEKKLSQAEKSGTTFLRTKVLKKQDSVLQTDLCSNEGSVGCEYAVSMASKVLCSTIENAGLKNKPATRLEYIRKFSQSPGANQTANCSKQRAQLFKIWKDDPGLIQTSTVRQNGNSFFQNSSLTTNEPTYTKQSDTIKAQERLDTVKQEFSKMVNITEDLLRKSYREFSNEEYDNRNVNVKINNEEIEIVNFKLGKCKNVRINNNIFDVGDGYTSTRSNSKANDSNITHQKGLHKDSEFVNKAIQPPSMRKTLIMNKTNEKLVTETNLTISKNSDDNKLQESMAEPMNVINFKGHVTKTINNIMDGLSKKYQFQPYTTLALTNTATISSKEKLSNDSKNSKSAPHFLVEDKNKICEENLKTVQSLKNQNNLINYPSNKYKKTKDEFEKVKDIQRETENLKKKNIIRLFGEALKKRNIILLEHKNEHLNSVGYSPSGSKLTKNSLDKSNDTITGDNNIDKKIDLNNDLKSDCNRGRSTKGNNYDLKKSPTTTANSKEQRYGHREMKETKKCNPELERRIDLSKNEASSFEQDNKGKKSHPEVHSEDAKQKIPKFTKTVTNQFMMVTKDNTLIGSNGQNTNTVLKAEQLLSTTEDSASSCLSKTNTINSTIINANSYVISTHDGIPIRSSKFNTNNIYKEYNGCPLCLPTEDNTSMCSSIPNTITTISNDVNRNSQDIYDKLDSTSATDSDISLRIDGKKSQIINITDLTNSLEDLAKLDKICRIIEISDELSDKLFSNLDNEDSSSSTRTRKKWSFKDLCEKINLDEFCNKVFGKCGD